MYKNLRILRESLGMTQAEFGKSVGIAKSTYNNYETGVREPRSDFWVAVAEKYGVTIDYLMGYSNNPRKTSTDIRSEYAQPQLEDEIDDLTHAIARHLDYLTEADKKLLLAIVKHLSTKGEGAAFRTESGGYLYLYGSNNKEPQNSDAIASTDGTEGA